MIGSRAGERSLTPRNDLMRAGGGVSRFCNDSDEARRESHGSNDR